MSGNPSDYLANPALDIISAMPTVWDETIVLPGSEPGKLAAMARRKSKQWFIGMLNGADSRALSVALDFLGDGDWRMSRLDDVKGRPDAYDRNEARVAAHSTLNISLADRGGFVAWLRR